MGLTSYLVSNTIVLAMGVWASTVMGRKRFFLLCIAIFAIASFSLRPCRLAPHLI
jgi:DHA2 family multidrug resistance protein